jgi:hypothetical protein
MAENIEVSAKSLAEKLDNAGLTDDEKAVVAHALATAFESDDVVGFSSVVGGAVAGTGAAAGMAAAAAGGGARYAAGMAAGGGGGAVKFGLATLVPTINNLAGSTASLNLGNSNIQVHIV